MMELNDYNGIKGADNLDERYLARCIAELKRWKAPLSGWKCDRVDDVREDDEDAPLSECDLCGCKRVRYEHYMEHNDFPFPVVVGCICAGIMEGDILEAKERERQIRNRSKRRRKFAEKPWKESACGKYERVFKGKRIIVLKISSVFYVYVNGSSTGQHKGKPIDNLLSAAYAAYDMIDPVSEVWHA